jgi:hypothetical protein
VWRNEIQIGQLLAEQGDAVTSSNENHVVFLGPPGAAKTTFARAVGDVLFGLAKIERPGVKEVTEADIVVGDVSQAAARMKEVCEDVRGGVLFIDEAYRRVPKTEGHSFGVDAINTLLKYTEDYRDELVVIVAGYPAEMRDFPKADAGLAERFHFTLTFASYTPDQVVAIGRHLAGKERLKSMTRRGTCCATKQPSCGRSHTKAAQCSTSPATAATHAKSPSPAGVSGPAGSTDLRPAPKTSNNSSVV